MNFTAIVIAVAAGLFLGTIGMLEVGRFLGRRLVERGGEATGTGAVEGAIFALLGLVIAFTFSGAASRFDSRRELIAQEANTIGTAWLRIDLLPESAQPRVRDLFRRYLDTRLAGFRMVAAGRSPQAEIAKSEELQREIWKASLAGCRATESTVSCMLLLPALNQMIDITTTRAMAARIHPPLVVFLMLGGLAFASSLLAGYAMGAGKARSRFHRFAFAFVIAATVYVIVDIEYPRVGLIRLDTADSVLVDMRRSME
jgi:Na+-driven multidrug efflux pump